MNEENKRGLLVGLPITLVITALLVLGVIYFIDQSSSQRTAAAAAEIVSAEPTTWSDNKTIRKGFRIKYRFDHGGKIITAVDEKNTAYDPSEQFRVCYDPKNPSDSRLHSSSGMDCGKRILF